MRHQNMAAVQCQRFTTTLQLLLLLLLLLLALLASAHPREGGASPGPGCSDGWVLQNSLCLHVSPSALTWTQALDFCLKNDAILLVVDLSSNDAEDAIPDVAAALREMSRSAGFLWREKSQAFWAEMERREEEKEESEGCLAFRPMTGMWVVKKCDRQLPAICQQSPNVLAQSSPKSYSSDTTPPTPVPEKLKVAYVASNFESGKTDENVERINIVGVNLPPYGTAPDVMDAVQTLRAKSADHSGSDVSSATLPEGNGVLNSEDPCSIAFISFQEGSTPSGPEGQSNGVTRQSSKDPCPKRRIAIAASSTTSSVKTTAELDGSSESVSETMAKVMNRSFNMTQRSNFLLGRKMAVPVPESPHVDLHESLAPAPPLSPFVMVVLVALPVLIVCMVVFHFMKVRIVRKACPRFNYTIDIPPPSEQDSPAQEDLEGNDSDVLVGVYSVGNIDKNEGDSNHENNIPPVTKLSQHRECLASWYEICKEDSEKTGSSHHRREM